VFVAVFSVFLLAIVVLCVLIVRWAILRDRARRVVAETPPDKKS
jgi:hypothetical protein